jgi:hypothetical protein
MMNSSLAPQITHALAAIPIKSSDFRIALAAHSATNLGKYNAMQPALQPRNFCIDNRSRRNQVLGIAATIRLSESSAAGGEFILFDSSVLRQSAAGRLNSNPPNAL